MFQQMQAMAQKQVNTSNALVIRFSVPMSPNKYNNNNNDNSNGNINILICEKRYSHIKIVCNVFRYVTTTFNRRECGTIIRNSI